jgi:hypothetical protein
MQLMSPDLRAIPFYSATVTFKSDVGKGSATDGGVEIDEGGGVVFLVSFVATPIPRHRGHAFRPDPNHYKLI